MKFLSQTTAARMAGEKEREEQKQHALMTQPLDFNAVIN